MSWLERVGNAIRPQRLSRELDVEIDTHLRERTDDLIAEGMARGAAEAEARRRFGNRGGQKERSHDIDTAAWLESIGADIRYALRALRRSPAFAAVAILSLALGIGANTAIFSLVDAVALRSLPVYRPEQLLLVNQGAPDSDHYFTNPLWEAIRASSTDFAAAFAYSGDHFNLANGGEVQLAAGSLVSGGFFGHLGVRPVIGRVIVPADDVPGCPLVAVVSDGFAERRFGGAAAAVGRTITLGGHPAEVIGVADPSFTGLAVGVQTDVYAPLCAEPILTGSPDVLAARDRWFLNIMLRPRPGISPAAVDARLAAIAPGVYRATAPGGWSSAAQADYAKGKLAATPASRGLSDLRDTYRTALVVLMIVAGAVLLIACANIANLLMARAASRQRELAIRLAIGAARRRLVRQLLTESLVLSAAGAVLGGVFARGAGHLLVGLLSTGATQVHVDLSVDGRVLMFTMAVAMVTAILFGLAPAWRAARTDPQSAMKSGGAVRGGRGRRLGRALVTGQVALSLALVACAGLLMGSFRRLLTFDPGFRRDGVLLAEINLSAAGFKDRQPVTIATGLLARVRNLPGVQSASSSWTTPLGHAGWNDDVMVPGYHPARPGDSQVSFNQVSDGYFGTMGTRLLSGRDINADDIAGARSVAVINATMATRMFGAASPLGRTFRTPDGDSASPARVVIGVVADAKYRSLQEVSPASAYFPIGVGDNADGVLTFEIRSTGPLAPQVSAVKALASSVSPAISLRFTALSQQIADSLTRPRLLAVLSAFFGALALLLAMIGLYGTIAYNVTQRRGEIGMRIALGAGTRRVVGMVVADAGWIVATGVVIGVILSIAMTRFVGAFLFGVTPADPATLGVASSLLATAGLLAAVIPAWRAATVDPVTALREE
jgi:putative ABC transport system permease protein